ncbi:hypothetical protein Ddc_15477 [Ditylenchus destructor]|nr:hypothetical protein Ddc_15477 [Ditylenchus destructor]
MPPRKKSRLTPVVGSGKNKPTAFKALCLPNTGFMVDFLGYFTRDDFEKYLQLTCKRMNQLILTHFHSKPYRYLDNVTLMCNLDNNMELCLRKPFFVRWDPSARQWTDSNRYIELSSMVPFLDKTVRVPKAWICQNNVMTQENIDKLKSLSHIWENAQVEFTTFNLEKNLMSRVEKLSEAKLFRCRHFKCSNKNDMLPLWDYPEIYSLKVVEIHFSSNVREEYDLTPIIQLVENQALYPHSQTTLLFSGKRKGQVTHGGYLPLITNDVLQRIGNKLLESDKAQSFRIIFPIYVGSNGEVEEFRLENNRTRKVLQLRRVTRKKVEEYCEFVANTKYFILEHSRA